MVGVVCSLSFIRLGFGAERFFLEKKGVSVSTFDVVAVVDWYIHEVATVETERAALFWFCEDIFPHCFGWAISDFYISIGDFVTDEEVSAFYVFCAFEA